MKPPPASQLAVRPYPVWVVVLALVLVGCSPSAEVDRADDSCLARAGRFLPAPHQSQVIDLASDNYLGHGIGRGGSGFCGTATSNASGDAAYLAPLDGAVRVYATVGGARPGRPFGAHPGRPFGAHPRRLSGACGVAFLHRRGRQMLSVSGRDGGDAAYPGHSHLPSASDRDGYVCACVSSHAPSPSPLTASPRTVSASAHLSWP